MGIFDTIFRRSYKNELDEVKALPALVASKAPNVSAQDELVKTVMDLVKGMSTPPKRGTSELIAAYNNIPRLRSIIGKMSESVASAQWKAWYRAKGKGVNSAGKIPGQTTLTKKSLDTARMKATMDGTLREVDTHPLLDLLEYGNPAIDGFSLMYLTNVYLDLVGEAFWVISISDNGTPLALWPVPPNWVQSTPTGERPFFRVNNQDIPEDDVVWFKVPDPVDPYGRGSGVGMSLGDELDTDEYAAQLSKAVFYNHAIPKGILSVKDIDDEEAKAFQKKLEQRYGGPRKAGRVLVTPGDLSYKRLDQSFDELQMIELRTWIRNLLQQTYGIPPEIVGVIESSNKATIIAAEHIMAKHITMPRLERIRRPIQTQLAPLYDNRLILDYESPIDADHVIRKELMIAVPWAYTVNQFQDEANFEGFGEAGEYRMVPMNMLPQQADQSPIMPPAMVVVDEKGRLPGAKTPLALPPHKASCCAVHKAPAMTEQQIQAVVDALDPQLLIDEALPVHEEYMGLWGQRVIEGIGSDLTFNMISPAVVAHLDNFAGYRITDLINATTRNEMAKSLVEGVRLGESIAQLKDRVHDVFLEGDMDIYNVRATRIARTEVGRSANFSTWSAQKQSGVIKKRQWVAALVNSRPLHQDINGQVRGINEPFMIDGASTMYPGNFGVAALDINCMCTTTAVVESPKDVDVDALAIIWKGYLQATLPWSAASEGAFITGFEKQLDDCLDTFDTVTSA